MTRFDAWSLVLLGLLVGVLSAGWIQEYRMLRAAESAYQRQLAGALVDQVILAEALKLAAPDPLARALLGAQAVTETAREGPKR